MMSTLVDFNLTQIQEKYAPKKEWEPLLYTRPKCSSSKGPQVSYFTKNFMIASRGMREYLPIELEEWQRWLVNSVLETKPDGYLRYRQVVISVPRKQGKTLIAAALALHALCFWGGSQSIFSIGTNAKQARYVYDEMVKQIHNSPVLQKMLYVTKDYIMNRATKAKYEPLPASSGAAQGLASSITIADEAHVYGPSAVEMYRAMHQSSGDRPESLMIIITTAGGSKSSFLGEMYEYGERIINGELEDDSFGMFWWGLNENDDFTDEQNWYKANPNLSAGLISIEEMRQKFTEGLAPGAEGKMRDFMRYRLNMWVSVTEQDAFIPDFIYEQNEIDAEIPLGASIALGFDGSKTNDSTGFVAIDLETGVIQTLLAWHKPLQNKTGVPWSVPRKEVMDGFRQIMSSYNVMRFWLDSALWTYEVQEWIKEFPQKNLIESQSPQRKEMVPMASRFREDFIDGKIQPSKSDKKLREHITNAIIYESGQVAKNKNKRDAKIDLGMAAILANGARTDLIVTGDVHKAKQKPINGSIFSKLMGN